MGLSPIHIAILAIVAMLLLGGGRFSALMGDLAKGVKTFKNGRAQPDDLIVPPENQAKTVLAPRT